MQQTLYQDQSSSLHAESETSDYKLSQLMFLAVVS